MSALVNYQSTAAGYVFMGPGFCMNDDVLQPLGYRASLPLSRLGRMQDTDVFWPRASFPGSDMTTTPGPLDYRRQDWEYSAGAISGRASPKVVSGIARDSGGSALAGATVMLFNTATGLLVDSGVSDAGGNFALTDPNNVACFVVAYKVGPPDVTGATVNTL